MRRRDEAVDAGRYMASLILGAVSGVTKPELLDGFYSPVVRLWEDEPLTARVAEVAGGSFRRREPPAIRGSGYVVESLVAALWAFDRSSSFREGLLLAVKLRDDADPTGAVYGRLRGLTTGWGIPGEWIETVATRERVEGLGSGLVGRKENDVANADTTTQWASP